MLHLSQFRVNLGRPLYRPTSIGSLWFIVLNLHNNFLLYGDNVVRYFSNTKFRLKVLYNTHLEELLIIVFHTLYVTDTPETVHNL